MEFASYLDIISKAFDREADDGNYAVSCCVDDEVSDIDSIGGYKVSCGASKIVFTDLCDGYVFKIPSCDLGNTQADFCKIEASMYAASKQYHIQPLFAKCEYIGKTTQGYSVYAQVKASLSYTLDDKTRTKYCNTANMRSKLLEYLEWHYDDFSLPSALAGAILVNYGMKYLCNFARMAKENHLNDFHGGNYGYSSEGKPILIDYSGYYDINDG